MTSRGNHTEKTRNSGVCVNQYMGQLRITIPTLIKNHQDICYAKAKTRIYIHTGILIHCFQYAVNSRKNDRDSLEICQSMVVNHIMDTATVSK